MLTRSITDPSLSLQINVEKNIHSNISTIHHGNGRKLQNCTVQRRLRNANKWKVARKNVHFHGCKLSVCMGSTMNISNILGLVRHLFSRWEESLMPGVYLFAAIDDPVTKLSSYFISISKRFVDV